MTKRKRLARPQQFTVTQKLGFKPVLHCWCGASCLHQQDWPAFTQEHDECMMAIPDQQQEHDECSVKTGREADYETAWAAFKRIEPHYSRTNRMLADM